MKSFGELGPFYDMTFLLSCLEVVPLVFGRSFKLMTSVDSFKFEHPTMSSIFSMVQNQSSASNGSMDMAKVGA